jgi:hypothetical protein
MFVECSTVENGAVVDRRRYRTAHWFGAPADRPGQEGFSRPCARLAKTAKHLRTSTTFVLERS